MAQIQQGAIALLCLVAHHDISLHLHRAGHRLDPCVHIAGSQLRPHVFQPCKELGISQHAVFDHFAIPCEEIARRERAQHFGIGQHQCGLMKGPNQVFSLRRIDAGLSPNGAVHLCQERGRNLHKTYSSAQHRGGKSRQIANHATAKGNHHVIAFDLLFQQPLHCTGEFWPALGALPCRQGQ